MPINKRELLYDRAMKAKEPKGSGSVSFQEFVNVVSTNKSILKKKSFEFYDIPKWI